MHTIKNNKLEVTIKTKGAELASLKTHAMEFIWQANPDVWFRHAPILFPIVGRLKDHEYIYENKTYKMTQHGFTRDTNFKVIKKSKTSILLEQISTPKSKEIYPFDFILQVKYTLSGKLLITEYIVKNPSAEKNLYFSIGAHPAFNCPFEDHQKRSEYELIFDKKVSAKSLGRNDGLIVNDLNTVFKEDGVIALPDTIFDNDALIFNPNLFSKVTFVHKPSQKEYLSVEFKNYPYLGIWSKTKASPFICVEPWHGITDYVNHNKELTEKEGIIKLEPKKIFSCDFSIEVLN